MAIISRGLFPSGSDARVPIAGRWLPGVTVAVTALLMGCRDARGPLAAQDSFFASPPSVTEHIGLEASAAIELHQALVAGQRACGAAREAADLPEETAFLCHRRTTRFFGRRAEAYRRWVEDQVRELPSPDSTASSATD